MAGAARQAMPSSANCRFIVDPPEREPQFPALSLVEVVFRNSTAPCSILRALARICTHGVNHVTRVIVFDGANLAGRPFLDGNGVRPDPDRSGSDAHRSAPRRRKLELQRI